MVRPIPFLHSIPFVHKIVISLFCVALMVILMIGASHFINRQQTELASGLQNITHQLIKQSTYSLGPLVHRYNTTDDDSQQISAVIQYLSEQPWIIDIAVYQLNGALIAQAGANSSVKTHLNLSGDSIVSGESTVSDNSATDKKTIQLVERIDLSGNPVGFIRLTVDPNVLQLHETKADDIIKIICFMLLLSCLIGVIITLIFTKWQQSENHSEK